MSVFYSLQIYLQIWANSNNIKKYTVFNLKFKLNLHMKMTKFFLQFYLSDSFVSFFQ